MILAYHRITDRLSTCIDISQTLSVRLSDRLHMRGILVMSIICRVRCVTPLYVVPVPVLVNCLLRRASGWLRTARALEQMISRKFCSWSMLYCVYWRAIGNKAPGVLAISTYAYKLMVRLLVDVIHD